MSQESVQTEWVTVETSGLVTRRHRLQARGRILGELIIGLGSSARYIDSAGRLAHMGRTSLRPRAYRMWAEGRELGQAEQSPFQGDIEVGWEGQAYHLRPAGPWALRPWRSWELTDRSGQPILTVRAGGWGRAQIGVQAPLDADLLGFVYYLVVMRWRAARRL